MAPEILAEIEQRAKRDRVPIVARVIGNLLSVLTTAMQANRILEIGTGYGFATLSMAIAQPPAGRIWTFDPDMERTQVAREYFDRAGLGERIEIINQPALDVLPIFPQRNLDIAFIDAPKTDYTAYLKQSLHVLKLSGLVILNGVHDADFFLNHPQLDAAILPLGDGLGIAARKA